MLNQTIATGLAARYQELGDKVHELAQPLSDEQFWRKPFGFGNSFGHLVLHLTGNLNYYIGAALAGSGYLRDRDREFNEEACPHKNEVLRRFEDAVAMVARTTRAQSQQDWEQQYTAQGAEDAGNRFNIFLRCLTHLHLHIGQMMYLQFELIQGVGRKSD